MKIELNVIHFVYFTNATKIVSQRAKLAERPGRKKSARAHLYVQRYSFISEY